MKCNVIKAVLAFVYSPNYMKYSFGPSHPFQPLRERRTLELLKELGAFEKYLKLYEPQPVSERDLMMVHTKEYIVFVKTTKSGFLDYGDTPATKELYEGSLYRAGGSILAANLVLNDKHKMAFNPGGGLHHAHASAASGFCVFNDVAIAVRYLQKEGVKKIAIIDVDGHHGDGTQDVFYKENILTVSLHRYDGSFFPGTGRVEEIGEGEGEGYNVNVPLPEGCDDGPYLKAFSEVVVPVVRAYKPEVIINQFGVDSHEGDPLVGLSLTTNAYGKIVSVLKGLSSEFCKGRYIILGGGGYQSETVARSWAVVALAAAGAPKELYTGIMDKAGGKSSPYIAKEVERTIKRAKELIFPYYNLK